VSLSPAQAKRQRAQLMREIARDLRAKQRAELATLRGEIQAARGRRRAALVEVRDACGAGKRQARERIRARRREVLEALKREIADERARAYSACEARIQAAHAARGAHASAREKFRAERSYQRELKRIERGNKQRRAEAFGTRRRGTEAIRESDDEVRGNIPPELVGLWERVKGRVRGSDRKSRTEAFLEYAESHPSEVLAALDDRTDAVIAELEGKERAGRRALRRPIARAAVRQAYAERSAASGGQAEDEVPF
jgi:hypothetical protein